MTAIKALLNSRKFLVMALDMIISLALYFTAKYAGATADDVKFIIAAIQPVAMTFIYAVAKEDAAAKSAGLTRPG